MNQLDEIAHVVQLSVAPVFLLTGVATLLNVLGGGLRASLIVPACLKTDWTGPTTLMQTQS